MSNPAIDRTTIQSQLKTPLEVLVFDKIDSTNTFAKTYLENHPDQTAVIVSESQTDGYGRFKRDFYSPQNTGIYMSLIMPVTSIIPGLLTTMAGLVTVQTLRQSFPEANLKLKWVNDILLNHKKVGGILVENVPASAGQSHLILGVGINLNTSIFPEELQTIAGSISNDSNIDRNKIISTWINLFLEQFQLYLTGDFLTEYQQLCETIGQTVKVVNGKQELVGEAVGIAADGSLILLDNQKLRHLINSGEVTKIYQK